MTRLPILALALASLAAPAFAQDDDGDARPSDQGATGALVNAEGAQVGNVSVATSPFGRTLVTGNAEGFPEGTYGVHLHEVGLCEGPDFESAGAHLGGDVHGILAEGGPHAGDLPNVHIQSDGVLVFDAFAPEVDEAMLFDEDGTALIVHGQRDDYYSQPGGDSGPRIACAVFEFDVRTLEDETENSEISPEEAAAESPEPDDIAEE